MHGVFMDILGLGVLITGESGLGKSELGLELISRGNGLGADDAVDLYRINQTTIEWRCPELLRNLLDVLGIGLDCDATRALVGQVDVADDFDTTVGGFSCASGLQGYSGIQETCVGGAGQTLRMGYYDTSSDQ